MRLVYYVQSDIYLIIFLCEVGEVLVMTFLMLATAKIYHMVILILHNYASLVNGRMVNGEW